MPIFRGAVESSGVYKDTQTGASYDYHTITISCEMEVQEQAANDPKGYRHLLAGSSYKSYSMKYDAFMECLHNNLCNSVADLLGRRLRLFVDQKYGKCQGFIVFPPDTSGTPKK